MGWKTQNLHAQSKFYMHRANFTCICACKTPLNRTLHKLRIGHSATKQWASRITNNKLGRPADKLVIRGVCYTLHVGWTCTNKGKNFVYPPLGLTPKPLACVR